jgi:hypothetical protein
MQVLLIIGANNIKNSPKGADYFGLFLYGVENQLSICHRAYAGHLPQHDGR